MNEIAKAHKNIALAAGMEEKSLELRNKEADKLLDYLSRDLRRDRKKH